MGFSVRSAYLSICFTISLPVYLSPSLTVSSLARSRALAFRIAILHRENGKAALAGRRNRGPEHSRGSITR